MKAVSLRSYIQQDNADYVFVNGDEYRIEYLLQTCHCENVKFFLQNKDLRNETRTCC